MTILFITCTNNLPFDKEKWNQKDDMFFKYRKQIVSDLVKNHLNSKMSQKELRDLLGQPDNYEKIINTTNEFEYEVYVDYGLDIDPVEVQSLIITFDKDSTLDRVYLKTWKHYKGTDVKELKTK